MRDEHIYVIVGEKRYIRIIRGPLALSDACDKVARLRLTGGSYRIQKPRYREGCLLDQWIDYISEEVG